MSRSCQAIPVSLPNTTDPYDFTEIVITQPYLHNDPLPVILELLPEGCGKYGIISGDANSDGTLKYIGSDDDRGNILNLIQMLSGEYTITGSVTGYYPEDVNLNNWVLYLGSSDDRAIILSNIQKLNGTFTDKQHIQQRGS
ncbi:MAG: hypothetical protein U5Q03_11815 [Bacteroidota bacterium]|nr:hypothetical protein [Bacteroidota bacterium]